MTNQEIVNKVRRYLAYIEKERNGVNKKRICKNMFSFLLENSWFLELNTDFKESLRLKLLELATIENQKFARDYYKKFFNKTVFKDTLKP